MKKILIFLTLFLFLTVGKLAATTTIGVFGGYPTTGLTFSTNALEFQLGFDYDLNNSSSNSLYISADYTIHKHYFILGSTPGFFLGLGLGPYMSISNDFELGVLAPVEFGFNIPELVDNRIDIYSQLAMGSTIIPSPEFVWGLGLGLRFRL